MTLAELKSALSRYGFDETDPLVTWINAALVQIVDEADVDWIFLEKEDSIVVTSGSSSFTLPTDCSKVKSLRDVTGETSLTGRGYALQFRDYQSWNSIENKLVSGQPGFFTLVNEDTGYLYPVPSQETTLDLLYTKRVPALVNSSDVPEIPEEYHYTIVRLAAANALMAENEEDRAQTALMLYGGDLERMKMKYASRQVSDAEFVQEAIEYT